MTKRGKEEAAAPPDVRSWAFWRKRLGRALIVGALALAVSQLLPAIPQEQVLEIHAPRGAMFSQVKLTYIDPEGKEPIAGTELTPTDPAPRVPHTIQLPNGTYRLSIQAEGQTADGTEHIWSTTREIVLEGGLQPVRLDP